MGHVFLQQSLLLFLDLLLLPPLALHDTSVLLLLALLFLSVGVQSLLPKSFDLSLVLLLLHPSLLLGQLLEFVLLCELVKHVPSELDLHSLFLFLLQSLSFLGLSFGPDHLQSLALSLLLLVLLLPSHLSLVLLLIQLTTKTVQFFCVSSPLLFLPLELLENLVLGILLLLPDLFDCFFSGVEFLDIGEVFGFFLSDELEFSLSLLFLDLQCSLHILEGLLLLLVLDLHFPEFAVEQGLHDLFDLFLFPEVLFIGLSLFLYLLIHLHLEDLFAFVSLLLLLGLDLQQSLLLSFLFLDHLGFELCLIYLNKKWEVPNHRLF